MKLCLVLVAISCLVGLLSAQNCGTGGYCPGGTCATVQSGNTVGGFVGNNQACISAVAQVNGLSNVNLIQIGQTLCIPDYCNSGNSYNLNTIYSGYNGYTNQCSNGASCPYGTCYTVQNGDTVSSIVGGGQGCISSVGSTNNINVNVITPGEVLCIPYGCNQYAAAANTYSTSNYYTTANNYCPGGTVVTVQSGNTVSGFVGGNQACINAVGTANNINVNTIYPTEQLCIPAGCYTGQGTTCACASGTCYTVQSGNTVSSIVGGSQNCINAVGSTNNINVNVITPGEVLCIPNGCNAYAAAYNTYAATNNYYTPANNYCPGGTVVTVQSGNTVSGFVGGNQACINAVGTANNINVNTIYPTEQLCIPSGCYVANPVAACTVSGTYYTVVSGDTCNSIASKYGISLATLYACNPSINNPNCNNLQPGQVLNV